MSGGLLQRLAAQAMGKMNTVRPLPRSRYAASFPAESMADPDRYTHTLAADIQPDREHFHPNQRDEKRKGAAVHIKPANSYTENAIQNHVEISSVPLESTATPLTELVMASISPPSRQTSPVDEKTVTEFSAESEQFHFAESDSISPLLPLTKSAQVAAWNTPGIIQRGNADRSMQTNLTQERREETTEVHVHIGRIEVRATVAAPPARKTPARSPTMSLDDYLKQRSGRPR